MQINIVATLIGIALVSVMPMLNLSMLLAALVALLLSSGLYLLCSRWQVRRARRWLAAVISGLVGLCWAGTYGLAIVNDQLAPTLEQEPVYVRGTVEGLPVHGFRQGEPFSRFDFAVAEAQCLNTELSCANFPGKLKLTWRDPPPIIPGQQWWLLVKSKRPRGLMNPGGFDYQSWLIQQGVGAVGYVLVDDTSNSPENSRVNSRVEIGAFKELLAVDYWRWRLAGFLDRQLSGLPHRPMIKALLIADKRDISPEQWQLFQRHGIIHLMVISGLHIGLVSSIVFILVRIGLLVAGAGRHTDAVAAMVAVMAAFLYCLAAGASLPTQRAFVMVAVYMLMVIARRHPTSSSVILYALLACFLLDPLAVASRSFWLSFVAVAVLMVGFVGKIGPHGTLNSLLRSQWLVFVGLSPVLAAGFGQISLDAPLVNMVYVPLFSLLVLPLAMLSLICSTAFTDIARVGWESCDAALAYMLRGLELIDTHLGLAVVAVPSLPMPLLLIAAFGVVMCIMPRALPLKWVAVIVLAPLFWYQPPRPAEGELDVAVLDVGQGLAVVVRTANHVLIYDVGARYQQAENRYFSLTEAAVLPYLRSINIDTVDQLVLSHGDNDHAGGWRELVGEVGVQSVFTGEPLAGLKSAQCKAGQTWEWDNVRFSVLWPGMDADTRAAFALADSDTSEDSKSESLFPAKTPSSNNRSCVLMIETGRYRFVLPGDIEADSEMALVKHSLWSLSMSTPISATDNVPHQNQSVSPDKKRTVVLVAPHHGSQSSSSWPLLKALRPDHVVFSAGYLNPFGHPHAAVVNRYRVLGTQVHSTSAHGAIEFSVRHGKLLTPAHYRERAKRYWL